MSMSPGPRKELQDDSASLGGDRDLYIGRTGQGSLQFDYDITSTETVDVSVEPNGVVSLPSSLSRTPGVDRVEFVVQPVSVGTAVARLEFADGSVIEQLYVVRDLPSTPTVATDLLDYAFEDASRVFDIAVYRGPFVGEDTTATPVLVSVVDPAGVISSFPQTVTIGAGEVEAQAALNLSGTIGVAYVEFQAGGSSALVRVVVGGRSEAGLLLRDLTIEVNETATVVGYVTDIHLEDEQVCTFTVLSGGGLVSIPASGVIDPDDGGRFEFTVTGVAVGVAEIEVNVGGFETDVVSVTVD